MKQRRYLVSIDLQQQNLRRCLSLSFSSFYKFCKLISCVWVKVNICDGGKRPCITSLVGLFHLEFYLLPHGKANKSTGSFIMFFCYIGVFTTDPGFYTSFLLQQFVHIENKTLTFYYLLFCNYFINVLGLGALTSKNSSISSWLLRAFIFIF